MGYYLVKWFDFEGNFFTEVWDETDITNAEKDGIEFEVIKQVPTPRYDCQRLAEIKMVEVTTVYTKDCPILGIKAGTVSTSTVKEYVFR